jgi:hypothetical protein
VRVDATPDEGRDGVKEWAVRELELFTATNIRQQAADLH